MFEHIRQSDDPRLMQVTMYRVECMGPGCTRSPQDEGEFAAWATKGDALDEAVNDDWYVRSDKVLCPDCGHMKICMHDEPDASFSGGCSRTDVTEADDGWPYCPEHIEEGQDSPASHTARAMATHTPEPPGYSAGVQELGYEGDG